MQRCLRLASLLLAGFAVGCQHTTPVVPSKFVTDRFFATLTTDRGDPITMYLDTGGGTMIFASSVARLALPTESVSVGGKSRQAVRWPFVPQSVVPPPIAQTSLGDQLLVSPNDASYALRISHEADGQLGRLWFADRAWTLDYPNRRVLLHGTEPPPPAFTSPPARRVDLTFEVDSSGRRTFHHAYFPVVIDGESFKFFLDTGAEIWLSPEAIAQLKGGTVSPRATSLIRNTIFQRWRANHPEWRVIERADLETGGAIIEVPSIEIAGLRAGPVWFLSYNFDYGPEKPVKPGTPFAELPNNGGLGGSALKYFRLTIDYPRGVAWFSR